ncbi:hypothetical protein EVAR_4614_1 [Eumeta japonica]|uniref:Uncharacterized protein n=1 Tax=Eumeta variegata TaxID=151549 RepID=A0A4C1SWD3_EUMVA|nr:hypothetical protein EVAR_4614_1 [Eumeta japonica]
MVTSLGLRVSMSDDDRILSGGSYIQGRGVKFGVGHQVTKYGFIATTPKESSNRWVYRDASKPTKVAYE